MNVIDAIRTLECTSTFVANRNSAMHKYSEKMKFNQNHNRDYSYINFAYGMVFYHGFYRLFTTLPPAVDAITRARGRGLDWISFGSNVGTETFYSALTWNLHSEGYDVLCALVDHSLSFRKQFQLEDQTNFHCKDALDGELFHLSFHLYMLPSNYLYCPFILHSYLHFIYYINFFPYFIKQSKQRTYRMLALSGLIIKVGMNI